LALVGVVEMLSLPLADPRPGILVEWLACAGLMVRRRLPVVAAVVVLAALLLQGFVGVPRNGPSIPVVFALLGCYALGRWTSWRVGLVVVLLMVVVILAIPVSDGGSHLEFGDVTFVLAIAAPPFGFGVLVRRLAQRNTELRDLTEQLRAERELVRQAAADAERTRLARELHDVLAHSVSAMVVQAAAAESAVDTEPQRAKEAMGIVADTGRRAIDETTRLLRLVRHDREADLEPPHRLSDTPGLVNQFRRDGLDVTYSNDVNGRPLPDVVDWSAYRIVQEVLTNALRYSSEGRVSVGVTCDGDRLVIQGTNRVRDGASLGVDGRFGLGLVGMRERAEVLGGSLTAGVVDGRRFRVRAELPLTKSPA
jgi:signal transduction histidine kinase